VAVRIATLLTPEAVRVRAALSRACHTADGRSGCLNRALSRFLFRLALRRPAADITARRLRAASRGIPAERPVSQRRTRLPVLPVLGRCAELLLRHAVQTVALVRTTHRPSPGGAGAVRVLAAADDAVGFVTRRSVVVGAVELDERNGGIASTKPTEAENDRRQ